MAKVKIPTTGRIGRFARALEKETNRKIVEQTINNLDDYLQFNNKEKAEWWWKTIQNLEKSIGKPTLSKVMQACGSKCCGITSRKRAKLYWSQSKSMKEFINNLNKHHLGGGRLKLIDAHTITGGYNTCYCGQVKYTQQRFPSDSYCQCSTAWYKQLFETSLSKPVKVEIKQSIIHGAKTCEFVIHI
jgi:Zn-dependent oligopeptidase